MKSKYLLIAVGSFAILLGGLSFGVANGTIPLSNMFVEDLHQGPPPDVPGNGATTTPPGISNAAQQTPPQAQVPSEPGKRAYGALMRTYADAKHGFSIKYPEGLEVSHPEGKAVALSDVDHDKGFGLSILVCTTSSPCPYVDVSATTTVEDLKREHTTVFKHEELVHTYGKNLPWKIIPTQNTVITLPGGQKVLKQTYTEQVFDDRGNDVTQQVCDMCGGVKTHYIALMKPGTVLVAIPASFNDPDTEARIIQSISY